MTCTYVPDFAFSWTFDCFIVCIDHKEFLLLPQWFCLTSFETYLNWGQFWKPPAGFTCHPLLPDLNLRLFKYDWIVHFLQPWEALLFSLKILFSWVFGLYKIQLVNSSAHHLEKNPAYISPPHRLSIWLQSSLKTPLPLLFRRCLDFQHSLNYDLFLSQCLATLKTIL